MHRTAILLIAFVACATAANIFDLLYYSEKAEKRDGNGDNNNCECSGETCYCCVNFNVTYIDLGGPGCVNLTYLSLSEGVLVNVSYGASLLQSATVKQSKPEPTCVALLANLAELCAEFDDLVERDESLRGCLRLVPKLLGDSQTHFDVGCFAMDSNGMRLVEETNATGNVETAETNNTLSEIEQLGQINEGELIAAAQQGLAFFGNLFNFAFGNRDTANQTESGETIESASTEVPN